MTAHSTVDVLKARGAMIAAPHAVHSLYREAFDAFGQQALWSSRAISQPSIADALAITESLRVEGGVAGRRLAERIIAACSAAL